MRKGDWIQTFTGRQVWPLDLRQEDICIEDIAHHLSMQCRFSGACRWFYSVAEHSVRVSYEVERTHPEHALWGLLHDASEAYLQDVVRPLKRQPELWFYREAENRAMEAICERFRLQLAQPQVVSEADHRLLIIEKRDLLGPAPAAWTPAHGMPAEPLEQKINPWNSYAAEDAFLACFARLTEVAR